MSRFNQQILAAKKQQRQTYIRGLVLFIMSALVVFTAILISQGIRIEIHPDEAAELSSIQHHKGFSVVIGDTLYSISKNPAINISAEGFRPIVKVLNKTDFGKVLSITLEPLPAKVELTTNINDEKTSWFINDKLISVSASFEHELEAGEYIVMVNHPYYKDASLALSLARDEKFKQAIALSLIEGELSITTSPSAAQITIDGTGSSSSPLNRELKGGIHELKIMLKNYQTINDIIEINRSNLKFKKHYPLQPKKAAITVSLSPKGGQLRIDKKRINKTVNIPVSKGAKHTLSYSKQGYFTKKKSITLTDDEVINLAFVLKKEMGQVEINSSPQAEVELNGKFIGNTPLQLSLMAVEQKITIQKAGFRSITKRITPTAAKTKKISATLVSEELAQRQETRKTYTHKAGGQLKLFRPNDTFTMGAHRGEKGQRANEFLKKVRLTKAFYAGINEVTNAEFRRFNKSKTGAGNHPVTSVLWIDAAKFCNWLSQMEGLDPVYNINRNQLVGVKANANGYRLLTEAEWEWLARKSAKSVQTRFVWGDEYVIPKKSVNIADELAKGTVKVFVSQYNDGYAGIAAVMSFTQEKSGLYDQGGNVSEWTHDNYSIVLPKSGKVFVNPFDLSKGSSHVVKGANWRSGSVTELRPSFREGLVNVRDDLGFRIGRYVDGGN